jgi:hypothetical protein
MGFESRPDRKKAQSQGWAFFVLTQIILNLAFDFWKELIYSR